MKKTKLLPYGMTNFPSIMKDNYYYVDKTMFISKLEQASRYFFFVRPRRFGKSLLLNVLSTYYDKAKKNEFEEIFGGLYIGKNPTDDRNKYLILNLNLSTVSGYNLQAIESSFNFHVGNSINGFMYSYKTVFSKEDINKCDQIAGADEKLAYICEKINDKGEKLYLIIDEYDNFANTILSSRGEDLYKELTHGNGFFRVFLSVIKAKTSTVIERIFLTGVSPVAMDDFTSGFNITSNMTDDSRFNSMIGFTETEVREMFTYYKGEDVFNGDIEQVIQDIKPWYDNYCFSKRCLNEPSMYNSDMVLYFLDKYTGTGRYPDNMLDPNVKTDYDKLRLLIRVDKSFGANASIIQEIVLTGGTLCTINPSFSIHEMAEPNNFKSMLYYLGLLTIGGTQRDKTYLKIPNIVVREQFYTYMVEMYKEIYIGSLDQVKMQNLLSDLAYEGKWQPYFEHIAQKLSDASSIRNFIDGEAHVQGFLLAHLADNDDYITYAEHEMNKGYADFYLQPNIKHKPNLPYSYVVEVKYAKKSSSDAELERLFEEAKVQLNKYAQDDKVQSTIGSTELKKLVVVFRGWELAIFREI